MLQLCYSYVIGVRIYYTDRKYKSKNVNLGIICIEYRGVYLEKNHLVSTITYNNNEETPHIAKY